MRELAGYKELIREKTGYKKEIMFINHHLCHMASTFHLSGFLDSDIITLDGLGDIESTCIGFGNNNDISILRSINYPNSLGMFYNAITHYLGFRAGTSEGTTMALAALGDFILEASSRGVAGV